MNLRSRKFRSVIFFCVMEKLSGTIHHDGNGNISFEHEPKHTEAIDEVDNETCPFDVSFDGRVIFHDIIKNYGDAVMVEYTYSVSHSTPLWRKYSSLISKDSTLFASLLNRGYKVPPMAKCFTFTADQLEAFAESMDILESLPSRVVLKDTSVIILEDKKAE
jgi:hypothetical protein